MHGVLQDKSNSQGRHRTNANQATTFGFFLLCFNPLIHSPTRTYPTMRHLGLAKYPNGRGHNLRMGAAAVSEIGTGQATLQDLQDPSEQAPEYLISYDASNKMSEKAIEPLVASFSIAGQDPERYKVNQDGYIDSRFCLLPPDHFIDKSEWCFTVAAVMDGHGSKGHVLVEFLREQLPTRIEEQLAIMLFDPSQDEDEDLQAMEKSLITLGQASPEDFHPVSEPDDNPMPTRCHIWRAIVRAFHLSQRDAQRDKNVMTSLSGCTCIVALINEKLQRVHVAHVGDSLAIKASITSGPFHESEGNISIVNAQAMCHTDLDRERERIEKSPEGRLEGVNMVCRAHLCVPMTRALGDTAMLAAGVLPTPIIEAVDLFEFHSENREGSANYAAKGSTSFNFLVMCTDGVSDVMTNEEVVQVAGQVLVQGGGVQAASEAVAVEARRRWIDPFPIDPRVDDITVTIVLLPPPKPSARDFREMADRHFLDTSVVDTSALCADAYHQVAEQTDRAVKIGCGQHGEVWKADGVDGSYTYAVKLIALDESRGFQIASGEQRAFKASGDLQRKAKRLANRYADDEVAKRKWERAANNIIRYHQLAEDWSAIPEVCYIVMEYVEGQPLDELGKSLSEVQRLSVYIQIAEVIDLLSTNEMGTHRAWVHRDIKPENVIGRVEPDGSVTIKIIDLGVILDRKTKTRNFYLGTNWSWVPFEQRKHPGNFAVCDGECISGFDMFSLGILILQLECGEEESRVISNPEDPFSAEAQKIVEDFFNTDLGKMVKQLTVQDPCQRPRPPVMLESLHLLHESVKVKWRSVTPT